MECPPAAGIVQSCAAAGALDVACWACFLCAVGLLVGSGTESDRKGSAVYVTAPQPQHVTHDRSWPSKSWVNIEVWGRGGGGFAGVMPSSLIFFCRVEACKVTFARFARPLAGLARGVSATLPIGAGGRLVVGRGHPRRRHGPPARAEIG